VQFHFGCPDLRELYFERDFHGGHSPEVVGAFRDCLQLVEAAPNLEVLAVFRNVSALEGGRYAVELEGDAVLTISMREGNPTDVAIIQSLDRVRGGDHDR